MPEFMCVQCFQCNTFQVQQVKKLDKFACRMCQAPQSVRKMYAISAKAKDIRSVVVDLNTKRSVLAEKNTRHDMDSTMAKPPASSQAASFTQPPHSQWTSFITEEAPLPDEPQDELSCPDAFVTSMPDKVQRKRKLLDELGHCSLNGAGSKKSASAAYPHYQHTAQAQHRMQGPSSNQQNKAVTRAPTDMPYSGLGKADSPERLQLASLSAAPSYSYQVPLPQETTHQNMPDRGAQFNQVASAAISTGGNMSSWSSFLALDHDEPQAFGPNLDEEDAWVDDGDGTDLVTAVD